MQGEPTDFVIYAGVELNNLCFFRKSHFSEKLQQYLEARRKAFNEEWKDIESFDELPIEEFPSIKCFGELIPAQHVGKNIESILGLHVPVIKDPFCSEYYVVQATHPDVSKGQVLRDLVSKTEFRGTIIAAGDDLNDLSMFAEAHIKVAMGNAPIELKLKADIVAPPASLTGIIEGLKCAIGYKNAKKKNEYPLVTVGGVSIVADDGDILLVHSPKWTVGYTIPGGKIELGESREEAARREVLEETGLHVKDIGFALVQDSIYSSEFRNTNHFVMNDFIARLSPQSSKDSVVLNAEGDHYRWIQPEKALELSLNKELYTLIEWYLKHQK